MCRLSVAVTALAAALSAAGCEGGARLLTPPESPLLSPGPTARVEVSCPETMEVGQSATCTAYGYDADGVFTGVSPSSWSATPSWVVTVTQSGTVTAVGPGDGTVSATVENVTGSTSITVIAPLQVSLDGPSKISPGEVCTWVAYAEGGAGGYTYSWSISGGSGSAYENTWTGTSNNFKMSLSVTVTDANGATASASKGVLTEESSLPPCPQ